MNIDPDVLSVLRMLAAKGDSHHQARLQRAHDKQTQRAIETQLELLSDEVEKVIPRSNPLFESVLLLTAINKVAKMQQEPEFVSDLEFPQGM